MAATLERKQSIERFTYKSLDLTRKNDHINELLRNSTFIPE